jgi:hypothetical protein
MLEERALNMEPSRCRDASEVSSRSVPGPSSCQRLHTARSLWQGNPVCDTTGRYLGVYSVNGHPPWSAVLPGAWEIRPRTLYTGEQVQSTPFHVLSIRGGTTELHRWEKYITLYTKLFLWTICVSIMRKYVTRLRRNGKQYTKSSLNN